MGYIFSSNFCLERGLHNVWKLAGVPDPNDTSLPIAVSQIRIVIGPKSTFFHYLLYGDGSVLDVFLHFVTFLH